MNNSEDQLREIQLGFWKTWLPLSCGFQEVAHSCFPSDLSVSLRESFKSFCKAWKTTFFLTLLTHLAKNICVAIMCACWSWGSISDFFLLFPAQLVSLSRQLLSDNGFYGMILLLFFWPWGKAGSIFQLFLLLVTSLFLFWCLSFSFTPLTKCLC